MRETFEKLKMPLKIVAYLLGYYLMFGFYVFWGSLMLLVAAYFLSDYLVSKVLFRYRELLQEDDKIRFDAQSRDEQIQSLSGDVRIYDNDIIYVRDVVIKTYACVGRYI